jgi:hypothetical protein
MIYCQISKIYPKKLGQAADEIFRVAAWTRSEFAVSLKAVSDKLTPKN